MKEELIHIIRKIALEYGIEPASVRLEYPDNPEHGDYSTNVAMANAKLLKASPKALADKIVEAFKREMSDGKAEFIQSISVAAPGFINFRLKDRIFAENVAEVASHRPKDGAIAPGILTIGKPSQSKYGAGMKIMIEYTDPNICKVFHVGHLMANAIGESLSRLIESSGAKVIRACYPSDVGLNVAKTIAAIIRSDGGKKLTESRSLADRIDYLGEMYVKGNMIYDEDEESKNYIVEVNKKIFAASDPKITELYERCRKWSLEYFDIIYKRLDTKFDLTIYEREAVEPGIAIVREFIKKGVFTESDGAIVFKGENYGLHTRVFITSQGLPTYETKELGLNAEKFKLYPDLDESIIVTANEQNDYFKVLLKSLELVNTKIAAKTKHLSHGLLRFSSGKMSSRMGNIVGAEKLIDELKILVKRKMSDRDLLADEKEEIADQIAIAAIKYTILRQAVGGDVIFDSAQSISFEGDSGPYLQYSAVRAASVLHRAEQEGYADMEAKFTLPEKVGMLEKMIARFPDIMERARLEYAPQFIATYLINISGAFNSFYGSKTILDRESTLTPYNVKLTEAFLTVMLYGLWLLGIKVPKKM